MGKYFLKNKIQSHGFTLLESIVAIAVLVMALAGPLTLAYQSIRFAEVAKDKLIAANLAQEGIELILAMRANNFLNRQNWLTGIVVSQSGLCADGGTTPCAIDAATDDNLASPLAEQSSSACQYLIITNGIYKCSTSQGSTPTFSRTINIKVNPGGDPDEAMITSTVSWTNKYGTSQIVLKEYMLNWPVQQI